MSNIFTTTRRASRVIFGYEHVYIKLMFLLQHNTIHIRRHDKWQTHFLLLTFFVPFFSSLLTSFKHYFVFEKFPLFSALRTHKRQWMENFVFKSHEKLFLSNFFPLLLLALLLLFSIDYNMCSRCCILSSSLYTKLFLFEFLTVFIFLFLFFLLLGGNTEKNSLCSVIIAAPCIIPYGRNMKDYGN